MGILATNQHILGIGTSGSSEYTAGKYIKIDNNEISVTGINPSAYALSADVSACCEEVSGKVDSNTSAITNISNNVTNLSASVTALNQNALTSVSHDTTITGDGTTLSPLGVVSSYELVAGSYMSLVDDDNNKTTTINFTGIPVIAVATSAEATGTNILYVITGAST